MRTRKRGKTFSYIFEAGKINGRRKVVEKGGFATKSAALKAGMLAYADWMHSNIGITSESITLKDFMTKWLNEVVSVNVKATSMQTCRTIFDRQIAPYLGEVKVQELTPAMLDEWIRNLQKSGLAFNTISAAHAFIHNALKYAVYPAQLISSNPAEYIKAPKNAPRNVVKRHIISPERFKALFEQYPFGSPLYIPLLLLYHTGMQISEVLSLSWQDIDFAKKRINLWRQIKYQGKRGHFFQTLKSKSSERYILINVYLLGELRRWQARQVENERKFGDSYVYIYLEDDGHIIRQSKGLPAPFAEKVSLICVRENGQMLLKEVLSNVLRHEGLNAYSLRHTHTTVLIENGASAKAVAGRLGHADATITQNLYTHNTLKLQEETAAIFGKTLQTNGRHKTKIYRRNADLYYENFNRTI